MYLHSEGLLQLLLTLVLASNLVGAHLHHGLAIDQNDLLDLLALLDSYADASPPPAHFPFASVEKREAPTSESNNWLAMTLPSRPAKRPCKVQIVHKEEPFFRPMRKSREKRPSERLPNRRIESQALARTRPKHRTTPKKEKVNNLPKEYEWATEEGTRSLLSKVKRERGDDASNKPKHPRWRKVTKRPSVGGTPPTTSTEPAWSWEAVKSEPNFKSRRSNVGKRKRNIVGEPVVKMDVPPNRDFYVESMHLIDQDPIRAPRFAEYNKRRYTRPPVSEEASRDPLESPITRMAVAVALGALVTCTVYGVAFVVSKLFPRFFGCGESEDEILQKAGRPVRYVPVPVAHESSTQTTMI